MKLEMDPFDGSKRCLVIARFQPLHYGHLSVLEWCFKNYEEVVVVIGMASQSHTPENPFTAGERIMMLRETVKWAGLPADKMITVTLPTLEVSTAAIHYVKLFSPPFKCVITLNPLIARIFAEEGYDVVEPPKFNREKYRGTYIRKLMAEGDQRWRELVPPPVAYIIDRIDGVSRVKMLYKEKIPGYRSA